MASGAYRGKKGQIMKIRIVSGKHGGRNITAPDGSRTHPMGERVRNAMFNSLGAEVENAKVLDAFAGTGSIGLEALSRGAVHATFVEKDRVAQNIIAENIELLHEEGRTKLIRASVSAWIDTSHNEQFDLIFADPPYHNEQFSTVHKLFGLLKPGGTMILSHPGKGEVPTETGVVVVDNRSYGTANLTLYRREDA
jgi:16S rRNA (guanine966-N2)-methyltransferase